MRVAAPAEFGVPRPQLPPPAPQVPRAGLLPQVTPTHPHRPRAPQCPQPQLRPLSPGCPQLLTPSAPPPLEAPESSVSSPGLAVVAAMAVGATADATPPRWEEPPSPNQGGAGGENHSPDAAPYCRRCRYRGIQDGGSSNPHCPQTQRRGDPAHKGVVSAPRPAPSGNLTNGNA